MPDAPAILAADGHRERGVTPDPPVLPDDAGYVLSRTRNCHGFFGAGSMERLPTERAITDQLRAFKRLAAG